MFLDTLSMYRFSRCYGLNRSADFGVMPTSCWSGEEGPSAGARHLAFAFPIPMCSALAVLLPKERAPALLAIAPPRGLIWLLEVGLCTIG
jgi:hypothetical protein